MESILISPAYFLLSWSVSFLCPSEVSIRRVFCSVLHECLVSTYLGPSSAAAIQLFFPFPQFDFQSFVAHKTLFRPLNWSRPSLYKLSLFKKIY